MKISCGWMNCFRLSETYGFADELDQLKAGLEMVRGLRGANNVCGPWFNSGASHTNHAYPAKFFAQLGLLTLLDLLTSAQARPSI